MKKVHFSGGLNIYSKNRLLTKLPGWIVCCSNDRVEHITATAEHTDILELVTCKACRRLIKREREGMVYAFGIDIEYLKERYGLTEVS
jgi:hypothetical protein